MNTSENIKPEFLEMISELPGIDTEAFRRAMYEPPSVSVKLNRRKCADVGRLGYGPLGGVAWCTSGFYLDERPKFTLNPLLHAGAFYVQDASSMIYETIVERLVADHGLTPTPLLLDMCAAPGGKTTSMLNALDDGASVVANEVVPQRARILRENLLKWGYPGIMVTGSPTSRLAAAGEAFDLVAVDAPCSGEGMMRKDVDAVAQWGLGLVAQCAALQREILEDAVRALRPGGFLIYSTCTFNRSENECNVEWLVAEHGLEPVDLKFPKEWGIGATLGSDLPVMRFMPHMTRGEGLFAAVLRKGDGTVSSASSRAKALETLRRKSRVILDGFPTVTTKGKVGIPAGEWPLSTAFPRSEYPEAELDLETALRYLRHEAIKLPDTLPRGFTVVTYDGLPLGFVKNIGSRANNLYPADWRIRNL